VDEGLPLDLFPALLTDLRAAFFLLPRPVGLGLVDLKRPGEGGQLVFQCGLAGIALAEDGVLFPARVRVTSSLPEAEKLLFAIVRSAWVR
jgi:hypothetical protein